MKNACLVATIALLSGCSLINSLDSVKPQDDDAGSGGKGGKGGKGTGGREVDGGGGSGGLGGRGGAGGNAGASGMGGTAGGAGMDAGAGGSPSMDAGAGGNGTGGTQTDGGGEDSGSTFTSGGPNGAIVVYDAKETKLFVLDPTDGHQVSATASPVLLAIVNDPGTDYWFAFRQVAAAGGPTDLQVKQLNTTTGEWKDIGKSVSVPTPINGNIGVLNQRLAYLSTATTVDPTASTFTVLDTTSVTSIFVRANAKALPAGGKVGFTARANVTDVGGSVSIELINAETGAACVGGVCNVDVSILGETITGNTIKEDTAPTAIGTISATGGSIGIASTETTDPSAPRDVVMFPPLLLPGAAPAACEPTSLGMGSAYLLDTNHGRSGPAYPFDIDTLRVNVAAFDPCHSIGFATSLLNDTAVWAIPMSASLPGAGTPQKLCSSGGGAALLYDRYTQGLVRVVQRSGVGVLEIYDVDNTDQSAPKLKPRVLKTPSPFQIQGVISVRRSNDCK